MGGYREAVCNIPDYILGVLGRLFAVDRYLAQALHTHMCI